MADPFQFHSRGLDSPAQYHAAIVPSDSADLPVIPRALYCQTAGAVAIRDRAGVDMIYTVDAGQILPFGPQRVLAAGTTATVVGWW
ncbi:spike base protein, RCAP_Rcc01079 family [Pseudogemmobacter humi]|uniref:Uncharacterized protein n=1 Tax=Pseudogemmobacter humi TaxID=2483812 RepID=A0A3P5XAA8_9RHOB|nr:hypothetical protein [Pseudogemmobacter humi]VDC31438.1 hypothetical protein XINFAN_02892 [Pseudogemmobacter humi]